MPDESGRKLRLEIGHVLFLDIVGYSKLLISEQGSRLQKLKEIVWATDQFRAVKWARAAASREAEDERSSERERDVVMSGSFMH